MKDKVVRGILVGLFADLVKLAANYLGFLLGFSNVVFWQITATRFLPKEDLFKPVAYLIGGLADLTIAALIGIVFIYLLLWIGWDNIYLKGGGMGLVVWVGLFGSILGMSVQNKLNLSASSIVVTAIAHLAFGFALAYFALHLGHKEAVSDLS